MKFRVNLLAKHWTYQTLNERFNAAVVILPIEKYKLMLNSLMSRIERKYCLISTSYLAGLFGIFILLHI